MPKYNYTARDPQGRDQKGSIEAASPMAANQKVRQLGLSPMSMEESKGLAGFFEKKVTMRDKVIFARQFATMLNSGLPLLQSLNIQSEQAENPSFQVVLKQVAADVETGVPLAEACGRHPRVFDTLFVSMLDAGERGGILDVILNRLAGFLEKAESLARKVKSAMIYPVVILSVTVICVVVLLIFVIPTFQKMFEEAGAELPLPTKLVVMASQFITGYWWAILGALAGLAVGAKKWAATTEGTKVCDRYVLKIPVLGDIVKKTAVARFTRTFGTLLKSGVPILDGLDITARTAGNVIIQEAILSSKVAIASGEQLAPPLAKSGLFPKMVTSMISVGEQSGGLDEMLSKVADFYDDEVDTAVGSLMALMEPIMIVVLGVVVGGMIAAMYLPIFGMIQTVKE